ncbi:hypothetical protein EHO61_13995 [Leptospira fluminis]|uniref:Uncharacterized protein n=1 Tax=Leptospira fluminis TaxID=2484979 RepID=A0A4R9GML5_9LEPT|nr:hypothetical protein [Leptospira fluminis]TGK17488.1 hypothetical protein EHO61_13995 [Leptospira fluminis]
MSSSIYNYFLDFSEFESYLKGRPFFGSGISAIPAFDSKTSDSAEATMEWSTKRGFRLELKHTEKVHLRKEWKETEWERKEDLFRFFPNPSEEIFFQALDKNRFHVLWKSERGIVFSGTLSRKNASLLHRIFAFFTLKR